MAGQDSEPARRASTASQHSGPTAGSTIRAKAAATTKAADAPGSREARPACG